MIKPETSDRARPVGMLDLGRRRTLMSLGQAASWVMLAAGCGGGGGAQAGAPAPGPAAAPAPAPSAPAPVPTATIQSVTTDKAAYAPGSQVVITVKLAAGPGSSMPAGKVEIVARHLDTALTSSLSASVAASSSTATSVSLVWTPPATDFMGYGLEVSFKDASGTLMDSLTGAVDVSSDWRRFPRYGFLTDYSGASDPAAFIEPLNALHINALQFYDWQWKHHRPVKGAPSNPDPSWLELSGKTVKKSVVNGLIDAAHGKGMLALQYNLIYGAAADFATDGVDARWGLFDQPGGSAAWKFGPFPSGWTTQYLYIFNPADTRWQSYILDREMEVYQGFAFDGWHADTVGDWGTKYSFDGTPVDIKTTFKPFLEAARARMGGRQLLMNVVGAKGHEAVNASPIDVPYMEIWPWDGIEDYNALKGIVDVTRAETGGKSLIVPAYMNYDYAKTKSDQAPGQFNEPGVLLTEATVMAAGGVRFELGDNGRMLCNEYFPNRSLVMGASLKAAVQRYWDFLVAYQNVLRDGQENSTLGFTLSGAALSNDGRAGTVWAWSKADAKRDIVQLINLQGVTHTQWRDSNATQAVPTRTENLELTLRPAKRIARAWAASPDLDLGRPQSLAITEGNDAQGYFVRVKLPRLDYWQMLVLERAE